MKAQERQKRRGPNRRQLRQVTSLRQGCPCGQPDMPRQSGGLRPHEQTEERIQRLPQHEGVLRANGDDQAPRGGQALNE